MITVDQALAFIFDLVSPVETETIPLRTANGRVLRSDVISGRDQPPAPMSAMDGYAARNIEVSEGAAFTVIGEAAAGRPFAGSVGVGQAVRIFTGGVVPPGADRVVIQEDVTRDGDRITLGKKLDTATYVRPAGADFAKGFAFEAPRMLRPVDLGLLATMNTGEVTVTRRPRVAIVSTGDEIRPPGSDLGPGEIPGSNAYAVAALIEDLGAETRILPFCPDQMSALDQAFDLASDADLIVTIGGASVGDHDLVQDAAKDRGLSTSFYKIAMRPGKPLMAGRFEENGAVLIGLPGNPVSSVVCTIVFVLPALRALLGLPAKPAPRLTTTLVAPVAKNGPREHYMRAIVRPDSLTAFDRQDSALQSVLSDANALLVRSVQAPSLDIGAIVEYLPLHPKD